MTSMEKLGVVKPTIKTGSEQLTVNGVDIGHSLLEFWRWGFSDILSNTERGKLAEFIVGSAIGTDFNRVNDAWGAYDLTSEDGIKIEVKTSAYIQSWYQNKYSSISFSIKSARYWNPETQILEEEPKRHADVYVFCLLKHKDQATIDPLKLEQWEFYVLSTSILDHYKENQKTIGLGALKKLAMPVTYSELEVRIRAANNVQQNQRLY